jgi:hypothetical protein
MLSQLLLSRRNHSSSQEKTKKVTAHHVRYQFWPFSLHVEKFVGIGKGFPNCKKGLLNIICTVKLHKVTTSVILRYAYFIKKTPSATPRP